MLFASVHPHFTRPARRIARLPIIVLLSLLFAIATAQPALAQRVTIPGTTISFAPPPGFTALTADEIAAKYVRGRPPRFVVGNKSRGTTVAYDFRPHAIPDAELERAMASFEQVFERLIAGIDWKKREVITLAGQRWILLEMSSTAIDTDIHNILLVTPHDGQLAMLNFNSTKQQFPALEAALRQSIASIQVK